MNASILDRIKKLLRLGQSSNPAEAALAMQRAFELAQKHGVDVDQLDLEDTEKLTHEYFPCGERPSFLRKRVLNIVVKFFRVEVCLSNPRVVFVGRETDVAIAGYVYEFLVWAGQTALRDFSTAEKKARRVVNAAKRNNFVQGFIYGIAKQLGQAEAQIAIDDSRKAIVLVEKRAREEYLSKLIPHTETMPVALPERKNPTALMSGFIEGEKTKINQPLNASQRETLALTA